MKLSSAFNSVGGHIKANGLSVNVQLLKSPAENRVYPCYTAHCDVSRHCHYAGAF